MKLLQKFTEKCGGDMPIWDFRLPKDEEKAAYTSAAAVVLCGILEIEKHKTNKYLQKYKAMLSSLIEKYINYDENIPGILKEQNGLHTYASYSDYYVIESYMKENSDIAVW